MGRLGRLEPIVGRLGAAVGAMPGRDEAGWRRWYKTARWRRLRWDTLTRDLFTCQMCGKGPQEETALLVADHRRAHRGDAKLFWDPANVWTLCKTPCHDRHKQRLEQGPQGWR